MTQRDEINGMLEQCQAMDAPIPETLPPQSEIDGLTRPIRCAKAPTSLDPAHESAVAKKLAQIPPMYQSTYRRAMRGKSLKAAARAFCLECVGWQRREVDLCTAPACPLYPYRTRGRRTAS